MEFRLVSENQQEHVNKNVNYALSQGFELKGELQVNLLENGNKLYTQVLVKKKPAVVGGSRKTRRNR